MTDEAIPYRGWYVCRAIDVGLTAVSCACEEMTEIKLYLAHEQLTEERLSVCPRCAAKFTRQAKLVKDLERTLQCRRDERAAWSSSYTWKTSHKGNLVRHYAGDYITIFPCRASWSAGTTYKFCSKGSFSRHYPSIETAQMALYDLLHPPQIIVTDRTYLIARPT